jgi:hypothetical protein
MLHQKKKESQKSLSELQMVSDNTVLLTTQT